jgi:hypothetical protein
MKPYLIKIPIAILFISIFVVVLNSCKKTENGTNKNAAADYRAKAIQATIERYGRVTAPVIFQPRQPASTISYKDASGNLILYGGTQYNRTAAVCGQYDCGTAPNPSDLFVISTLEYVKWFYTCGNLSTGQHDLTATWKVSTPYALLDEDPSNPGNFSFGNIRIKSGSTVLITSGNLGVNIENLGTDPNCSSNTLYNVTYTWLNVADTYFPGNLMECSFTVYNDCDITNYSTIVGYTQGFNYTNQNDVFTHPCDRTDQAWVNPPSVNQTYATVAGAYSLCTPPFGFTGTTDHQVAYRAVDHSTSILWDDQTSTPHGGVVPNTTTEIGVIASCCGFLNFLGMTLHSGKWLVRYRNRHSGCSPNITGFNDNWNNGSGNNNYITEYWNFQ